MHELKIVPTYKVLVAIMTIEICARLCVYSIKITKKFKSTFIYFSSPCKVNKIV